LLVGICPPSYEDDISVVAYMAWLAKMLVIEHCQEQKIKRLFHKHEEEMMGRNAWVKRLTLKAGYYNPVWHYPQKQTGPPLRCRLLRGRPAGKENRFSEDDPS
jgi:hypothetical protein